MENIDVEDKSFIHLTSLGVLSYLVSNRLFGVIILDMMVVLFLSVLVLVQISYFLHYDLISLIPLGCIIALMIILPLLISWKKTSRFKNENQVVPMQGDLSSTSEQYEGDNDENDDEDEIEGEGEKGEEENESIRQSNDDNDDDDNVSEFSSDSGSTNDKFSPSQRRKTSVVKKPSRNSDEYNEIPDQIPVKQSRKVSRVTEVFNWIDNVMQEPVAVKSYNKRRLIKMKSSPRALGNDEKRLMYRSSRLIHSLPDSPRKNTTPIPSSLKKQKGGGDIKITPRKYSISSTIAMIDNVLNLNTPKISQIAEEKPSIKKNNSNISWDNFNSPNRIRRDFSHESIDSAELYDVSSIIPSPRASFPDEYSSSRSRLYASFDMIRFYNK